MHAATYQLHEMCVPHLGYGAHGDMVVLATIAPLKYNTDSIRQHQHQFDQKRHAIDVNPSSTCLAYLDLLHLKGLSHSFKQ
jgi:hypothetical protein